MVRHHLKSENLPTLYYFTMIMPNRMFKYRLYPNKTQTRKLEEHLELCRLAYNSLLDSCKQRYKEKGKTPTQFDLNKLLPMLKRLRPELSRVYSQVLQNVAKHIRLGYENFFARRRAGLRAGLPRFKKYGQYKSITYLLAFSPYSLLKIPCSCSYFACTSSRGRLMNLDNSGNISLDIRTNISLSESDQSFSLDNI